MFIKKSQTALLIVLLAVAGAFSIAFAQGGDVYNSTGSGQSVVCRGERDFATTGITIWNQFMDPQDFYEYWKDITVRYFDNFCYYEDIYSLIKRIDKARTQIRKAFYSCTMDSKLKDTYYKLELELYFLRNYVDYKTPTGETWTEIAPIDEDWYSFSRSAFNSREEQRQFFNILAARYRNRLDTYKNCRDPGIQNMIDTFNADMEYLENTVNSAGKAISNKANRLYDTASSLVDAISSGEFFQNLVEVRINGMRCPILGYLTENDEEKKEELKQECLMSVDQLNQELKRNSPNLSVSFTDLEKMRTRIAAETATIKEDTLNIAEYELKYMYATDSIIDQFTSRLDGLKNVIEGTFNYERQTINCVKFIGNQQCNNL
jgi:hypothetical protein